MRRPGILVGAIAGLLLGTIGFATAEPNQNQNRKLKAELKGFEEIPTLSTPATGEFEARISRDRMSVEFELRYEDLETPVTQAHIHLGAKAFNGGIMVYLCSNLPDPPPDTQACPGPFSGSVEGSFTAEDVIGPTGQGISAGEFEEAIRAMLEGATYANVHTEVRTGGEIRGQINSDD